MMTFHIGKRIQEIARQKRLTRPEIKDAIGTERSPSYTYKKQTLPIDVLWRISERMNHNFFADLHPVTVENDISTKPDTKKLSDEDFVMEVAIRVRFPVNLTQEFGTFLTQANLLGSKMGFRVGEAKL